MPLSVPDKTSISERAGRLEARTGVEVVAAVVGRCNAYPDIPWKVFALLVSSMPPWLPGQLFGKPVPMKYTLPMHIKPR